MVGLVNPIKSDWNAQVGNEAEILNKPDLSEYVTVAQGTINAGLYLGINEDGNVEPTSGGQGVFTQKKFRLQGDGVSTVFYCNFDFSSQTEYIYYKFVAESGTHEIIPNIEEIGYSRCRVKFAVPPAVGENYLLHIIAMVDEGESYINVTGSTS